LAQTWVPADKLAAEIAEEYETVVELSKKIGKKS
jgi:hypothetical protein